MRQKVERHLLRKHLLPAFGQQMLYSIGIEQVETFLGRLASQVSPHTARRAHDVLRKMLQDAKRWTYITENPAWGAERPRPPHREMHVLSIEEASRLIRGMPTPWRPLVLTALLTGCRWGELAGLLWTDVDLDSSRLHVRRQIAANTTEPAAPKSRRGIRTIHLLPPVREAPIAGISSPACCWPGTNPSCT